MLGLGFSVKIRIGLGLEILLEFLLGFWLVVRVWVRFRFSVNH